MQFRQLFKTRAKNNLMMPGFHPVITTKVNKEADSSHLNLLIEVH